MLGGGLIDESKQYTIESPTYKDLNLDLGTPISLYLISDETINGRFSKSYISNDNLETNLASSNICNTDTLSSPLQDFNSGILVIYLPSDDKRLEVPLNQIKEIHVKPITNATYFTVGIGLAIDLYIIFNFKFRT